MFLSLPSNFMAIGNSFYFKECLIVLSFMNANINISQTNKESHIWSMSSNRMLFIAYYKVLRVKTAKTMSSD